MAFVTGLAFGAARGRGIGAAAGFRDGVAAVFAFGAAGDGADAAAGGERLHAVHFFDFGGFVGDVHWVRVVLIQSVA
jgi:hypothetical protein